MNGAELWVKWRMLGITVAELGELLDLNPRTLTRWMQKPDPIPDDVADRVDRHVNRHNTLVSAIWDRYVADSDGTEPVGLPLLDRQEDVPDWAGTGTNPDDWNAAVVAVYREATDSNDVDVEWHRYLDGDR